MKHSEIPLDILTTAAGQGFVVAFAAAEMGCVITLLDGKPSTAVWKSEPMSFEAAQDFVNREVFDLQRGTDNERKLYKLLGRGGGGPPEKPRKITEGVRLTWESRSPVIQKLKKVS